MPIQEGFTDIDRATVNLSDGGLVLEPSQTIFGRAVPTTRFIHHKGVKYQLAPENLELTRERRSWVFQHGDLLLPVTGIGKARWQCAPCRAKKRIFHLDIKATTGPASHLALIHAIKKAKKKHGTPPPAIQLSNRSVLQQQQSGAATQEATPHASDSLNTLTDKLSKSAFKDAFLTWITTTHVPFKALEHPTLKEVFRTINPAASTILPTRNTARAWVVQRFQYQRTLVKDLLRDSKSLIHVSLDLWTSPSKKALLGIVAHFIDGTGTPRTLLLALRELLGVHNGANISELLINVIKEYKIDAKIGFFVGDNADNNDTAVRATLAELRPELDPTERRIRCIGHVINLIAQAFLGGTDERAHEYDDNVDKELLKSEKQQLDEWRKLGPVGKLHNIVRYIRVTPQRRGDWLATPSSSIPPPQPEVPVHDRDGNVVLLQDPIKHLMVIQNNQTRWNSTYKMIQRAVRVKEKLDTFFLKASRKKKKEDPIPVQWELKEEDWFILTHLLEGLAPFEEATMLLQGNDPTSRGNLSSILIIYEALLTHCLSMRNRYLNRVTYDDEGDEQNLPNEEEYLGTSANQAWLKARDYYSLTEESWAYASAIILKPDWKLRKLEELWKDKPEWITPAKTRLNKAFEQWVDIDSKAFLPPDLEPLTTSQPTRAISSIFSELASSTLRHNNNPRARKLNELSTYLFGYTRDLLPDESAIQWWLAHERVFPTLTSFALSVLSIPAMEAECERVFSSSRQLLTSQRSDLDEDVIEANECLRDWYVKNIIR